MNTKRFVSSLKRAFTIVNEEVFSSKNSSDPDSDSSEEFLKPLKNRKKKIVEEVLRS